MKPALFLFGLLSFFALVPAFWVLGQNAPVKGWKAGVGRVVITPEQGMWMAGYAGRTKPAEGKLHELWAKTTVLEDENGQRAALLSFDLSGMPKSMSDRIRQRLHEKYALSKSQILLNFSHTHSGPVLRDYLYHIYKLDDAEIKKIEAYSDRLEDQVVAMVGKAIHDLEPVSLYAENGVSRLQVNRRNNVEATLHLATSLNGPNDYAVPVIKAVDAEGQPKAILFGYACHPTVLGEYLWSGDYVGFAQIALEKAFPGTTAMFFQGAGGDQNPLPRRSVALAEQYGNELAAAVERVLAEEMRPLSPQLSLSYTEVDLPLNDAPSKEALEKMIKETSGHFQSWAKMYYDKVSKGEQIRQHYPYPLQVWKIGDQTLINLGGEVVVDYAIKLKNQYGNNIFVFGYSNDVMAYIPSTRILREGGYEGATSQIAVGLPGPWKPEIEAMILHEIGQLVTKSKNVFAGEKKSP